LIYNKSTDFGTEVMNVERSLKWLNRTPDDIDEWRRAGSSLGDELPCRRLETLQAFRIGLARIPAEEEGYIAGYRQALIDVTLAAEAMIEETEMEAALLAAIRGDWRAVLSSVREGLRLPGEIAAALDKDKATITRILNRLREMGLVELCPVEGADRRCRPHRLTVLGLRLLRQSEGRDEIPAPATATPAVRTAGGSR
jgi:DNA-binding transcriptional ArsR family regulator